uniref:Uncharacterized protein n=1 Tax=Oryza punctata TaxID=4537 RepID=A0A0E0L6A5_ORYPU
MEETRRCKWAEESMFQKFSCVLSRSMANRPTSAEEEAFLLSTITMFLMELSAVLPRCFPITMARPSCLSSKVNHPTIGVVPFEGYVRASRTFFSCTKPNHQLPSLGATNYLESAAADFEA